MEGKKYQAFGEKLYNIVIMVFMSAIFGMFAQFIYVHMVIYRNLTPNLTKGQKG